LCFCRRRAKQQSNKKKKEKKKGIMDFAVVVAGTTTTVVKVAVAAGVTGVSSCNNAGGTLVARRKAVSNVSIARRQFYAGSSSCRHNAVAANVVGEICSLGKSSRRARVVMRTETAATGYAQALAELAQGKNALEAVNKDVEKLTELLNNNELYEFLVSPVVEDDKKKSILKAIAEDADFRPDITLSFLFLLVDKKRLPIIKDINKEFQIIFYESTDTQVATVTSAVKIEQPQLVLIAKKIQILSGAKNVRIKNVVDPSLIAGFLVKYGKDGSRFIDMSVKGQLDRLASQFESAEKSGVMM
jgi:F-type H+-transporting ATPase subunit delta